MESLQLRDQILYTQDTDILVNSTLSEVKVSLLWVPKLIGTYEYVRRLWW